MDGQTCGEEGFEAMEEASGKNEATNVIPEAAGDAVGEEGEQEESLGEEELVGEEIGDPVPVEEIPDGGVAEDGNVENSSRTAEDNESNVQAVGENKVDVEDDVGDVPAVDNDESDGRAAALRRGLLFVCLDLFTQLYILARTGAISAEHIEEPEENDQENVC